MFSSDSTFWIFLGLVILSASIVKAANVLIQFKVGADVTVTHHRP